jgi:RTX calcium-binding nonapeptide repeat (4 copies)
MQFPSRRTRIALLAGIATLAFAGTASAASTSDYNTTTKVLSVTVEGTATVTVTCDTGKAKVDGDDPTRDGATAGATSCAAPVELSVAEKAGTSDGNDVDLRGVTPADFTSLAKSTIDTGAGSDSILGTGIGDTIDPGDADDRASGLDGDDTLIWNPGDDSDEMNGGDGVDTVLDNGGGGDEEFVVKPRDGDPKRVDASRINIPFTLNIGGAEKLVVAGNGGNDKITGSPGLADLIRTTMTGGDGNDVLVGTDGNDNLSGGAGNDSVTGARGNDDMAGDEGDDILIWNPGEGTDKFEGGPGNDVAQDNGGAAAEHFVVSPNGQRVTATRDNGAPFFLDIGTSETLDLNAGGGDDSVDVNNGLAALIKVDADLGDGNDSIKARNDSAQVIDGGTGNDSADVDATDQVRNVEALSGAATADRLAPKVQFLAARTLAVKGGKARVRVRCPAGESACKGRIKILRRGKVVGSAAIKLAGGQTKTFDVGLARRTRIALAKAPRGKLAVKVRIRATDAAGNTGKVVKRLALKR